MNNQTETREDTVSNQSPRRMARLDWREILAALGVMASLVFVGAELRQANIQARAASYQAIGLATAELHRSHERDRLALVIEGRYRPESLSTWSAVDWEYYHRAWLEGLRIFETLLLQVEQGLLPADAIDSLGYRLTPAYAWNAPAFVCLWPLVKDHMGSTLRELLEAKKPERVYDCSHIDLQAVFRSGPLLERVPAPD